jgi:23S rRNA (pseudouridine1915-N3)-methyltransferase
MKLLVAAIGKAGRGPEQALIDEYRKRLPWRLDIRELEYKKHGTDLQRKQGETALLAQAAKDAQATVALDERGELLNSREFAAKLGAFQREGLSSIAFVIGGSDGLDFTQLPRVEFKLSFGRMSWPHILARAMLAEQLYRAHTILQGHPYHRE